MQSRGGGESSYDYWAKSSLLLKPDYLPLTTLFLLFTLVKVSKVVLKAGEVVKPRLHGLNMFTRKKWSVKPTLRSVM